MKKAIFISIILAAILFSCLSYLCIYQAKLAPSGAIAVPPYDKSVLIKDVIWELGSLQSYASGSDLWPITWGDDGCLYTAWGDGGGFGGTNRNGRVSLGVARLEGTPPGTLNGINIFGGRNALCPATFVGKPSGLVCIDGILYMGVVEQGKWLRWKIGYSKDHGCTWKFNGGPFSKYWDFAESDGAFSGTSFLQFGRNYSKARDEYVYAYSQEKRPKEDRTIISLLRVPRTEIMNCELYEYFAGMDQKGRPMWTKDLKKRKPVFTDPNGVGWGVRVVYNPGLRRYLLTTWHSWDGSWGIFDAPEPWGPWTTVAYYDQWIDDIPKFGFAFPQKWMSADGKTMWMVFSGTGKYDCFNVIKCVLKTANSSN